MATYPNNPLPWNLTSGRWIDANGDTIPLAQDDERSMLLAKISDLEAFVLYEKARVTTAESVASRLSAELVEVKASRDQFLDLLGDNLTAWDREEESVRDEHAELIFETRAAIGRD